MHTSPQIKTIKALVKHIPASKHTNPRIQQFPIMFLSTSKMKLLGHAYIHCIGWLSVATLKNNYPYLLGTLFSEELLQQRDVVFLSF
jgi:hypothetical protein